MKVILLCIGFQCLLTALCIQFSYGSFIELQKGLSIISCSCLFIWLILCVITAEPKPSKPSKPLKSSKQFASFTPNKSTQARLHSKSIPTNNSNSHNDVKEYLSPQSPRQIKTPSKSLRNKTLLNTSANNALLNPIGINSFNNDNERVYKRNDYLDWNEYFLSVAALSAMRSKDPSTQVGACIVNRQKRIVGIGYNGFPVGCDDDKLPWNRTSNNGPNGTKYPYVCHAEMNAILNKNSADCNQCTIYVSMFPCNECAKLIIQSGIKTVVFICDKYAKTDKVIASKTLLNMAGVQYKQYTPKKNSILITFPQPN